MPCPSLCAELCEAANECCLAQTCILLPLEASLWRKGRGRHAAAPQGKVQAGALLSQNLPRFHCRGDHLLLPPLCRLFSRKETLGVQDPGFAKSPKAQLWAGPSSFQWDTPLFPYSHIFPILLAVVGLQCHGLGHLLGAALNTRSFCRSQL